MSVDTCVFCGCEVHIRMHHLIPRCKKGNTVVPSCLNCESYIHSAWSHNELRDTYNNVETILANEKFQKFLKWRLKQPLTAVFKSDRGNNRSKRKYS